MNNETLQMILTIVGIVGSIGIFAGGIGFLFSKFQKGNKEDKADALTSADQLTNFWKEQVEGFKLIIADQTEKIRILTGEVGELRGQLVAEKKQNEMAREILQNRDPETKRFMEHMVQSIKDHSETHKEIIRILGEIHSMSIAEHDRDFKVTANVTKV